MSTNISQLADALVNETSSPNWEPLSLSLSRYLEPGEERMLRRILKDVHEDDFRFLDVDNLTNAIARVRWIKENS